MLFIRVQKVFQYNFIIYKAESIFLYVNKHLQYLSKLLYIDYGFNCIYTK